MENRTLFTFALIISLCLSAMAQQGQPCHDFDNQNTNGWTLYNDSNGSTAGGVVTNGVANNPIASTQGASAAAGDFGLHITDRSGSTWLYNQGDFTGDFTQRVGECLCFDFQLLNDEQGAVVNPSLFFFSGFDPSQQLSWGTNPVMAARFTATTSVTANSGWVRVCAPIDLCDSSGNLPSNAEGAWTIVNGGASDCADWQSILSNVSATAYAVDMSGWGGQEEFELDNICIEDCEEACAEIVNESIICNPDGTATLNFSVLNTSGSTLDEIEIVELPGNTSIVHYNYGINLASGNTYGTISLTVPANTTQYCTRVRLFGEDECCHIDYCVDIPICNPCDSISITSTPLGDPNTPGVADGECCHSIDVHNQFSGSYFTHITSTITTPGVTFSSPVANSGWTVAGGGNALTWTPSGGFVPYGTNSNVMDFCLDGVIQQSQTPQEVIFDWWAVDAAGVPEIVCSDTLYFNCTECLLVSDESIVCLDDGSYQYNFTVWNMTNPAHDATHIRIVPIDPVSGVCLDGSALPIWAPLTPYPLPSGGSSPVSVNISDCGAGLTAGSNIGFRVILTDNEEDLDWCCHAGDTLHVTLPDCPSGGCPCDSLQADINLGIQVADGPFGNGQCSKILSAPGLRDCDQVMWMIDGVTYGPFVGTTPFNHVFYDSNPHTVCIWVTRTNAAGEICAEAEYCTTIDGCPDDGCACDDLQADINLGVQVTDDPTVGECAKTLTANGLKDCDEVTWIIDGIAYGPFVGTQSFTHVFPSGPISHTVCIWVLRTTPSGEICEMEYCFEVLGCPINVDECTCETLQADISMGIQIANSGPFNNFCTKTLSAPGLKACDEVTWLVDGITFGPLAGDESISYTFGGTAYYNVCMMVTRTTPSGEICEMEYCTTVPGCNIVVIDPELTPMEKYQVVLSPNPTINIINIQWRQTLDVEVESVRVLGMDGREALPATLSGAWDGDRLSVDASSLESGTYFISIRYADGHRETRKFVKLPAR